MAISPSFHRFRLFTSFIGLLDLKLGCTIFTLFNLFNKSAGVFGLLAIFQGGNLAQLSLYAYSLGTIFFSLWGLRGISEESSPTVMLYAHLYLADHMISSIWSFYFFQMIYYHTEHNGQPPTLSRYQSGLITLIESIESQYETKGVYHTPLEGSARTQAAQQVWKGESGFSGTVLILAWLLKIYFALLLYSYALHLRHGTYRSLPLYKPSLASAEENRNGYLSVHSSISVEHGTSSLGERSSVASRRRLSEQDLSGWSDDEIDQAGEDPRHIFKSARGATSECERTGHDDGTSDSYTGTVRSNLNRLASTS